MTGSLTNRLFRNRLLIRAPIGLYRIGLGFLFGHRLMMLEHRGRRSGEARFVVLEVVTRPSKNDLVIASALGREAQWFQNLVAEPNCFVSIGFRRRVPASALELRPEEAGRQLAAYQAEHPGLWKRLNKLMTSLHGGDAEFELPLLQLSLNPEESKH